MKRRRRSHRKRNRQRLAAHDREAMNGRPAALAGLPYLQDQPDCMYRRLRASRRAQTRDFAIGAIVMLLDF
ncbi:hypothetical protein [Bradyrhizobium sp. C-145]|uniref:hypothetical protein n=1 Tax=unclassified Bradyrhizobium TaxID=2631580 RepID=UPI00201B6396|nr:hypothetical protein [Bradyrhizobium sp. C-145]UQR67318.1 hypothetical protein LRP30_19545 [Bradyrhizobium sp. C-145]